MEKHRFKTAEFAALCGVKKDTLLHYDHIGLLKPQWVGGRMAIATIPPGRFPPMTSLPPSAVWGPLWRRSGRT